MDIIIRDFILGILLAIAHVYCWNKLLNKKIEKNKIKSYFLVIIAISIGLNLSNYFFPQPIVLILNSIYLTSINYFFISKDLQKSLILSVISQIIMAINEVIFVIIGSLIVGSEIDTLIRMTVPFIFLHIYILCSTCFIVKTKIINKVYKIIYNNKTKLTESIIYSLMIIITMIIATIESHIQMSFTLILIINTLMAIIFISIIIKSRKIKDNYNKISNKYETSVSSLKEYEVMIDKFKVDTHENRNEFLTIRNMLKGKTKKVDVIKYIDKLVDNKIKDNDKIMRKTAKIPSGGLRATIYSKLCLMDKLKIDYTLNISRDVSTTDLIDIDEDLISKICKILGVFLDNAIEAVKGLRKKEIMVDIYKIDNSLCIDIANNFKGNLNLEKINDMKYTTKGEGHGYGLTLVNDILMEEIEKLENEKSINGDTFTQTLKIKNVE